jgi:RNA polymerase sigma-70 factor, ECF subfamily
LPPQDLDIAHLSDHDLIMLFKKTDDKRVIGLLYKRYVVMSLAIARKYFNDTSKAEDVVMAIFEKLLTILHQHQIQNFRPWLHSVVKNHCLMELRSSSKVQFNPIDLQNEADVVELDLRQHQDGELSNEQWLIKLTNALAQLNTEQNTCIKLFYLENKSYQEVAQITGFTMLQVKSHIQNGKRNLKNSLSKSIS